MQFNTNLTTNGPVPYRDAIRSLEKIQQCTTPREKLQCLNDSFSALKTAVVDYHKGKLELAAMDDVLPLTIYVVSQAEISHIASQFDMLNDFIKINDQLGVKRSGGFNYELEKKILTNYNCGVLYVSGDWEIPKIEVQKTEQD